MSAQKKKLRGNGRARIHVRTSAVTRKWLQRSPEVGEGGTLAVGQMLTEKLHRATLVNEKGARGAIWAAFHRVAGPTANVRDRFVHKARNEGHING